VRGGARLSICGKISWRRRIAAQKEEASNHWRKGNGLRRARWPRAWGSEGPLRGALKAGKQKSCGGEIGGSAEESALRRLRLYNAHSSNIRKGGKELICTALFLLSGAARAAALNYQKTSSVRKVNGVPIQKPICQNLRISARACAGSPLLRSISRHGMSVPLGALASGANMASDGISPKFIGAREEEGTCHSKNKHAAGGKRIRQIKARASCQ